MKKNIIMGMAVLMMAGCAKVESVLAPEGQMVKSAAGEKIEITVTLPEVEALQTRVTLKENAGGGFDTGWEAGDKILVGGNEFALVSADGMTGKFSGNMPEGNTFDIVYPAAAQQAVAVQKADKDYSHIKYSVSLLGVNSLEDVHFSHAWAGVHGGKFAQSGCLKAVLNLPANTAAVTGVEVSGEGIETLSLSVENGALSGSSFTAYIPCGRIELDSEKKVTIAVTTANDEALSNSFFPGTQILYEGYLVSLVTSASKWQKTLNGKGSESDPYMVNNYEEFNNIRNIISPNTYTYFKLAADIDMSAVKDWQPINNLNEPYGLMFDGCGHKITGFSCTYGERASVFGILHGEVKNLILEDASVVTTTSSPCGVVAAVGLRSRELGLSRSIKVSKSTPTILLKRALIFSISKLPLAYSATKRRPGRREKNEHSPPSSPQRVINMFLTLFLKQDLIAGPIVSNEYWLSGKCPRQLHTPPANQLFFESSPWIFIISS